MKYKLNILLLIGFVASMATSCNDQWDNHFDTYPKTVNQNLWDAMQNDPQINDFVELIKAFQLDTIFASEVAYTVIVPDNEAVASFIQLHGDVSELTVRYNIITHLINSRSIKDKRQVQTLTKKFALFEQLGGSIAVDGIEITGESPLYLNGKYYTIDQVNEPKPNLYEYYSITNPVLSNFIDKQNLIELDPASRPIGFDDSGNTIYDSIFVLRNLFEEDYFQVKQEFRTKAATLVFPRAEDYNKALDIVAESLGGSYKDHNDIPIAWQEKVLIPSLIEQGLFLNRLEPDEFIGLSTNKIFKLVNILGDSVEINYTPTDKAYCSNGYAYNYLHFEIPFAYYKGTTIMEAEELLIKKGSAKFAWAEGVKIERDITITPLQDFSVGASNDSIIRVEFPKGYEGKFSVEFKSPDLFPRKYLMVMRTHMDYGGLYNFYVNGERVGTVDYYDYVRFRGFYPSADGVNYYTPEKRFNRFDMIVNNLVDYGKANIKIEYAGPSRGIPNNGLVLDYIEFKPFK